MAKARIQTAPQMVIHGRHEHAGARAVTDWKSKDLACSFCGENIACVQVSSFPVEVQHMPIFDGLGQEFGSLSADRIDRRCAKLAKFTAAAAPLSAWDNLTVLGRSPKPAAPQGTPSPSEGDGQKMFALVLAAREDWLSAIRAALSGPLAVAAVLHLGLREPCRAAWQFNPALPVDPEVVSAYEAHRSGKTTSFFVRSPELEVKRTEILLDAWADARPEIQDAAVNSLTGGPAGYSQHGVLERWQGFTRAQKARAMELHAKDKRGLEDGTIATLSRPLRTSHLTNIGNVIGAMKG
ncbi:hypothetical protein [Chondromyces crocatus]|uniref:Uncharacterized protein n=1 Tax=Chondromyces crocatus TaxID=52 RepID=A0A0K1E7K9_CHOCO|nr:hypothetical protein [Chondromyces crocatus]AKT36850.1 uncharacterized protein CMC5_009710 [Chondromyces crocatus]